MVKSCIDHTLQQKKKKRRTKNHFEYTFLCIPITTATGLQKLSYTVFFRSWRFSFRFSSVERTLDLSLTSWHILQNIYKIYMYNYSAIRTSALSLSQSFACIYCTFLHVVFSSLERHALLTSSFISPVWLRYSSNPVLFCLPCQDISLNGKLVLKNGET